MGAAPSDGDWERDGYLVVRGAIDGERVEALRAVAERVRERYLDAEPDSGWPGDPNANSIFAVHRPEFHAGAPEGLADLLALGADPRIVGTLTRLFGAPAVFRNALLWCNPQEASSPGHWHRDTQYTSEDERDERSLVTDPRVVGGNAQVHWPLHRSDHLEVVPGSHRRWDTDDEYAIRRAAGGRDNRSDDMPGAARPALEPGDALLLNAATLHRGRYFPEPVRRTISFTYTTEHLVHERPYFPLDQPWLADPQYLAPLRGEHRAYFERVRTALAAS